MTPQRQVGGCTAGHTTSAGWLVKKCHRLADAQLVTPQRQVFWCTASHTTAAGWRVHSWSHHSGRLAGAQLVTPQRQVGGCTAGHTTAAGRRVHSWSHHNGRSEGAQLVSVSWHWSTSEKARRKCGDASSTETLRCSCWDSDVTVVLGSPHGTMWLNQSRSVLQFSPSPWLVTRRPWIPNDGSEKMKTRNISYWTLSYNTKCCHNRVTISHNNSPTTTSDIMFI